MDLLGELAAALDQLAGQPRQDAVTLAFQVVRVGPDGVEMLRPPQCTHWRLVTEVELMKMPPEAVDDTGPLRDQVVSMITD
jgi:hypothetical protein